MGGKISSFLESYITTTRLQGQQIKVLGRTKAKSYHMTELGRLSLLTVATGPLNCEKVSNFEKITLSGQHQLICPSQMHYHRPKMLCYLV